MSGFLGSLFGSNFARPARIDASGFLRAVGSSPINRRAPRRAPSWAAQGWLFRERLGIPHPDTGVRATQAVAVGDLLRTGSPAGGGTVLGPWGIPIPAATAARLGLGPKSPNTTRPAASPLANIFGVPISGGVATVGPTTGPTTSTTTSTGSGSNLGTGGTIANPVNGCTAAGQRFGTRTCQRNADGVLELVDLIEAGPDQDFDDETYLRDGPSASGTAARIGGLSLLAVAGVVGLLAYMNRKKPRRRAPKRVAK